MSDEKIIVMVDEDIEELIPGFLKNRTADVQLLNEAINADDMGKIQSIGHSLKGVGGGYGFDGLSELGAKIETAAKEKNASEIKTLVEEMASYMTRVEVVYE